MLKIGHRGAKGHLAENTVESIQKAIQLGADMIEVDVHRCKSGELVVIHDFTLDRITDGSGEIMNHTWSELKALRIENKYKIPLLTAVLDTISGQCAINIELKGSNTAAETCKIVQHYVKEKDWSYSDFIISSFQKDEIIQVFETNKNIPIGVLTEASMTKAILLAKQLNAYAIHLGLGLVTHANIKKAQQEGFKIIVWTVNEPKDIARMKGFGVDGIISDFPELL